MGLEAQKKRVAELEKELAVLLNREGAIQAAINDLESSRPEVEADQDAMIDELSRNPAKNAAKAIERITPAMEAIQEAARIDAALDAYRKALEKVNTERRKIEREILSLELVAARSITSEKYQKGKEAIEPLLEQVGNLLADIMAIAGATGVNKASRYALEDEVLSLLSHAEGKVRRHLEENNSYPLPKGIKLPQNPIRSRVVTTETRAGWLENLSLQQRTDLRRSREAA